MSFTNVRLEFIFGVICEVKAFQKYFWLPRTPLFPKKFYGPSSKFSDFKSFEKYDFLFYRSSRFRPRSVKNSPRSRSEGHFLKCTEPKTEVPKP